MILVDVPRSKVINGVTLRAIIMAGRFLRTDESRITRRRLSSATPTVEKTNARKAEREKINSVNESREGEGGKYSPFWISYSDSGFGTLSFPRGRLIDTWPAEPSSPLRPTGLIKFNIIKQEGKRERETEEEKTETDTGKKTSEQRTPGYFDEVAGRTEGDN